MQDISSKTAIRGYPRSSSFQVALLFTSFLALATVILVYGFMTMKSDFERNARGVTHTLKTQEQVIIQLKKHSSNSFQTYLNAHQTSQGGLYIRHEANDGVTLGGQEQRLTSAPLAQRLHEAFGHAELFYDDNDNRFAGLIVPHIDDSQVIIALPIESILSQYVRYKLIAVMMFILVLGLVIVSFIISLFVVSRTNMIANTAKDIMRTGDLSRRISINGQWDDLSNLAQTLNHFLSQIEQLVLSVREVSRNIAHDLRTPLTRLRNNLEGLQTKEITEQDLSALLGEADRILDIFQALLRITTIEHSMKGLEFKTVHLTQVLQDVSDFYEPVAQEKAIHIETAIAPNIYVKGDSNLLFQLFANLLDNAVKYSPVGATLLLQSQYVRDTGQQGYWQITLSDSGPGIPDSDKNHVFKHFYRGEKSRHTSGHGLGLSLVEAIATHHACDMTLEDTYPQTQAPGLTVKLKFLTKM